MSAAESGAQRGVPGGNGPRPVEVYRAVQIFRNFMSPRGTGRRLAQQRGYRLVLSGYGELYSYAPSLEVARQWVDTLHREGSPQVLAHLAAAAGRAPDPSGAAAPGPGTLA